MKGERNGGTCQNNVIRGIKQDDKKGLYPNRKCLCYRQKKSEKPNDFSVPLFGTDIQNNGMYVQKY